MLRCRYRMYSEHLAIQTLLDYRQQLVRVIATARSITATCKHWKRIDARASEALG